MQRVEVSDKPSSTPSISLTLLESTMLNTILRAFVRGLNDHDIQKEATRGMALPDRSLQMIYNLAEKACCTSVEIQKLMDKEAKTDQLEFYKSLVE